MTRSGIRAAESVRIRSVIASRAVFSIRSHAVAISPPDRYRRVDDVYVATPRPERAVIRSTVIASASAPRVRSAVSRAGNEFVPPLVKTLDHVWTNSHQNSAAECFSAPTFIRSPDSCQQENRFSRAREAMIGGCITLADAVDWRVIRLLRWESVGERPWGSSIFLSEREDTLL